MATRFGAINVRPEYETDEFEPSSEGPRFWTRDTLRQIVERVLGRYQLTLM